ncbi:MAG: hypothetical protein WCW53_14100 [Syntrophales bacterium]
MLAMPIAQYRNDVEKQRPTSTQATTMVSTVTAVASSSAWILALFGCVSVSQACVRHTI